MNTTTTTTTIDNLLEAFELRDAALAWLEAVSDELPRTIRHGTTAVHMRNRFDGLAFNLRVVSAAAINDLVRA